jgi:aubergine-like protein
MVDLTQQTYQVSLPVAPTRRPIPGETLISLVSNSYKFRVIPPCNIYVYSVSFQPEIPADNHTLKRKLITKSKREISKHLGNFVVSGDNIFSKSAVRESFNLIPTRSDSNSITEGMDRMVNEFSDSGILLSSFCEIEYYLQITKRGEIPLNDAESQFLMKSKQYFNILVKSKLRDLGLVQLGIDRNNYMPNEQINIEGQPLVLWPGYYTSVDISKIGLQITIDSCFKLLRSDTVLDYMDDITFKNGSRGRRLITEELVGKIVMVRYGRNTTYKIEDILFHESPMSTFSDSEGKPITYMEYYSKRYQQRIEREGQPLILARKNYKSDTVRLIPELCKMTGLNEQLLNDRRVRDAFATHTKLNPDKKRKFIQSLADKLSKTQFAEWNVDLDKVPISVSGYKLPSPNILLNTTRVTVEDNACFPLINKVILRQERLQRWMVFHTDRDTSVADSLILALKNIGKSYGIEVANPRVFNVNAGKQGKLEDLFIESLYEKVHPQAQIVLTILPKHLSSLYSEIKKVMTKDRPIPHQNIISNTVSRNKIPIFAKIILQMTCKAGASLWGIEIPKELPANTMLIGIDVCHIPNSNSNSVLGFCATVTNDFSKYFNGICMHNPRQEIADSLNPMVKEALARYYATNDSTKPDCIIIYRDGVGTSQFQTVVNDEIPQVVEGIKNFDPAWKPQLVCVLVNKRVNNRFFYEDRNPPPGTLVDSGPVWPFYNFFMFSQNTISGTSTPTQYSVVYDESQIRPETLQLLTYRLCHMYYNWTGGIRVPAPCQYAHKLAFLVGKHTKNEPHKSLSSTYYFL